MAIPRAGGLVGVFFIIIILGFFANNIKVPGEH